MAIEKIGARRLSRVQLSVGSTICLTSSFGVHAAASDSDSAPADSSKEVVITGHPSVNTLGSSLQNTPQNVTVVTFVKQRLAY